MVYYRSFHQACNNTNIIFSVPFVVFDISVMNEVVYDCDRWLVNVSSGAFSATGAATGGGRRVIPALRRDAPARTGSSDALRRGAFLHRAGRPLPRVGGAVPACAACTGTAYTACTARPRYK